MDLFPPCKIFSLLTTLSQVSWYLHMVIPANWCQLSGEKNMTGDSKKYDGGRVNFSEVIYFVFSLVSGENCLKSKGNSQILRVG